jgi:hypothetical protein
MFGLFTKILASSKRKTRPARPRFKARLHVEELLPRVLPNASPLSVVSGHLLIHGTHHNDLVSISVDAHHHSKLDVSVNHHTYQVNAKSVNAIVFMENGGHDRVINKTGIVAQLDGGSGQDDDQNGQNGQKLEATLSSTTSSATGKAEFNSDGELDVQVKGETANASLPVSVDGNQVGTLTTDANGNGELELSQAGLVKNGSTITVGDLTGTFAAPAPEVHLVAQLTGTGSGTAKFSSEDNKLHVEINGAAANTTYNITIDGNVVGQITTDDSGAGEFRVEGGTLTVNAGSTISIADTAGNPPILTGTFAAPTGEGDDNGDDNGQGSGGGEDHHHDGEGAGASLQATLTGASSSATGTAAFNSAENELVVGIQGAAPSTTLPVVIDGTQVATIATDANGNGRLELEGSGLTVKAGSTITVGSDLTGTFAAPTPEVHLFAMLTGTTGATGVAVFSSEGNKLEVEITGAAANTTYNITIDNTTVGQVTTDASGQAEFHAAGGTLTVNAGSAISVADTTGTAILQGTFAAASCGHGGD